MIDDTVHTSLAPIKLIEKNEFRVPNVPNSLYYIPEFISNYEEEQILSQVYAAPKPKWTCLSNRRLQNWGGVPHAKGMIAEPIPSWLQRHIDDVQNFFPPGVTPNHVLVNEYTPGQGIMAHTDGPLFHPVICTISCGSHTVLNFHKKEETAVSHRILLEPRSLLIVTLDLYHEYLHSISELSEDTVDSFIPNLPTDLLMLGTTLKRNTRVSLTIRHVPSTTTFKLKFSK